MEEKYLSDEKIKGSNNLGYFTKWLKSLGDYRASNLSDVVLGYLKKLFAAENTVSI